MLALLLLLLLIAGSLSSGCAGCEYGKRECQTAPARMCSLLTEARVDDLIDVVMACVCAKHLMQ